MIDRKAARFFALLFFALSLKPASAEFLAPVSDLPGAPMAPGSPPLPATPPNLRSPQAIAVSTGFDGTEPTIPGRIFRDGNASTCAGKAFPGTLAVPNILYDTFVFNNNGPERCVTVNFDTGTCGTSAHASAYLGSFNPLDLSQNYLGDVGSSVTQPFSFIAPANSSVVIVVTTTGGPTVCNYSFSSQELDAQQRNPATADIPTLQEWALALMGLLLGGLVWRRSRRKESMSA